jgi:multiple antibiotic resistance protein
MPVGHLIQAFFLAFPALFSIVNPLAGAIIFTELTALISHAERAVLARRVAIYSALVMLISLVAGSYILSFFGVSLNALRIAGGLVVSLQALEMLSSPQDRVTRKQAEATPAAKATDPASLAFFPLTLPLTTGPGTIAVAISLGSERPDMIPSRVAFLTGAAIAALVMAGLIWISYTTADRFAKVLGASGRNVVARLAAFLLLGIGVQIMLSGVIPVLRQALDAGMR